MNNVRRIHSTLPNDCVCLYVDIVDNIHYMFIWVLSANINHGGWRHRHTLTGVFDTTITLQRDCMSPP